MRGVRTLRGRHAAFVPAAWCVLGSSLALALPAAAALQDDQPPPYIGTPPRVVERMLALAKVRSTDLVMDLGSGDGRIVLEAARRFGARALGVEMNAPLVAACQAAARKEGLAERATCRQQDVFTADLSQATVLTLYLSPEFNERLAPRILQSMRPGARVVSHDFAVGGWMPDAVEHMHVPEKNFGRGGESTIMLFVVPANAAGRWQGRFGEGAAGRSAEFSITQQFQRIEGALHAGGDVRPFVKATLDADRIAAEIPDPAAPERMGTLRARIDGDRMTGTFRRAGSDVALPFSAQRTDTSPGLF